MNVWLCPVKSKNWKIIRQKKLFGISFMGHKKLSEVRIGDLLVFYVLKPINGIVAIYRVTSNPFEDTEDVWGRHQYPYRVRIEPIPEFVTGEKKPIPLYLILGKFYEKKGIIIEPYLRGVSLLKLNDRQLLKLKNYFKVQTGSP